MIHKHCGKMLTKTGQTLYMHHWRCDVCGQEFKQATRRKAPAPQILNWRGMPAHPTDQWLFWKTKTEEIEAYRKVYDLLTRKMNVTEKQMLEDFIQDMRSHAVTDHEFSSSEGA